MKEDTRDEDYCHRELEQKCKTYVGTQRELENKYSERRIKRAISPHKSIGIKTFYYNYSVKGESFRASETPLPI